MKIVVAGTRGIPDILGGVETHCQELYPRISKNGHEVVLIRRMAYVKEDPVIKEYKGVKLKDIWTPKQKSFEAIIHTFLSIIYAKKIKADILHIHAIGPAIMIPFARLLGLKVVMTHHGPDYDRQKWNFIAKNILMIGEKLGICFANKVIVISKVIDNLVKRRCNRAKTSLIFNGVNISPIVSNKEILEEFGLVENNYIVGVGRFVPEKGFHDLIRAYMNSGRREKLVLIGDADHISEYCKELKKEARKNNVILTGFRKGDELKVLFSNAKLFVLPSYHEGLPIVLLEAMSYGLDLLVSDISANKVIGLDDSEYFIVGDIKNLSNRLNQKLDGSSHNDYRYLIKEKYNWEKIAKDTMLIYDCLSI